MTKEASNAKMPVRTTGFGHSFVIMVSSSGIRLSMAAIRLYQLVIPPARLFLFGPTAGCRFTPSCSNYAMEAIHEHGVVTGSRLAVNRICRCHPLGTGGHDPVPAKSRICCHG